MSDAKEEKKDEDYDSFMDSFDEPIVEKKDEPLKPEIKPVETLPDTDSFDEPKGDKVPFEPMFSTAAGTKIDVKQESIDRSRKMLTADSSNTPSSSSKRSNFTSPFIRKPPTAPSSKQFVSPFRRGDEPSTSSKRPAPSPKKDVDSGAPPTKKSTNAEEKRKSDGGGSCSSRSSSRTSARPKIERKEIHADVLRISRVHEKEQYRLILQESSSTPLILGSISFRRGNQIKFGDRLQFDAEILKKDEHDYPSEVYIEKVLKNRKNGARKDLRRHSIADKPFCLKPKFIHELHDFPAIRKTVLQINILDLKIEIYEGCSTCRRVVQTKDDKKYCSKCKSGRISTEPMVYCRLRVSDFSGQLFLNIITKTAEKFLELLGYQDVEGWFKFQDPNERSSYVFRSMMMEIEKDRNDEWEVTDVAEVNWTNMADYLEKIVKNECK